MGPQIDTSPVGAPAQPANSGSQTTSASELTELTNALSKYVGLGEWAEAVRILQSLISLDRTNTYYYLRLGDYSLKAGNQAEAIRCYYEAADLYFKSGFSVKAIGTYNMILKIAPGETLAPMLMKLAEAQKQQVMKDEPQHSETLTRCLHSYHEVTTLGSGNESRVLDRLT